MSLVDNSYSIKKRSFESRLDSLELLVLGSSQALQGIAASELSLKSYNLANASQSLYYDKVLSLKYANRLPKLKYILLFVSYFSLGYELFDSPESWRDYYYYQYWQVENPKLDKWDLRCYSKTFLYTPRKSISYLLGNSAVSMQESFSPDGFLKIPATPTSDTLTFAGGFKRVQFHNSTFNKEYVKSNKANIEEIISGFHLKGVKTILISPPVNHTYAYNVDAKIRDVSFDLVSDLAKKYNCKFYNYFNDTRFIAADFVDHDHLNFNGARKLTGFINAELKAIGR